MTGVYISVDGREYEITSVTNHKKVTEWFQECLNCQAKSKKKITVQEKDIIKRISLGLLWKK